MRALSAGDFSGRVTFITGPEKHSGKTTLLNRALGLLRVAGEAPAFLGVGFDGESRDSLGASRKPRIRVEAGELFVSAERYLLSSSLRPEILEVLPGSSALGRLALARAGRGGEVVLVGPERNDLAAWIIGRIREEGWANTVVVDGAINRITQVSAFAGARFLFAMRLGPAELERAARRARLIAALASLPSYPGSLDLPAPVFELKGPLTSQTAHDVPEAARTVVVEDFTKVFLDEAGLAIFRRGRSLAVRTAFEFGGFVLALKGLSPEGFRAALGDSVPETLLIANPYEWEVLHGAA